MLAEYEQPKIQVRHIIFKLKECDTRINGTISRVTFIQKPQWLFALPFSPSLVVWFLFWSFLFFTLIIAVNLNVEYAQWSWLLVFMLLKYSLLFSLQRLKYFIYLLSKHCKHRGKDYLSQLLSHSFLHDVLNKKLSKIVCSLLRFPRGFSFTKSHDHTFMVCAYVPLRKQFDRKQNSSKHLWQNSVCWKLRIRIISLLCVHRFIVHIWAFLIEANNCVICSRF